MKCPNCGDAMTPCDEFEDWACPECGLCGPADTLEALRAKLVPPMTPERDAELEQDETAAQRALREHRKGA